MSSCIKRNYDYFGADIKSQGDVASLEDCAVLCQVEKSCLSVAYIKASKNCWLKNKVNGLKPGRKVGVDSVNIFCSG